ncbi:hypothetical protein D3C83_318350 [compost metagenome]
MRPSPISDTVSAIAAIVPKLKGWPGNPTIGADRNTRSNIMRSRVAAISEIMPPIECPTR